jgi:CheY-like chemotaxis protein
MIMEGRKLEILIVEDNPGDAYLISELLGELGDNTKRFFEKRDSPSIYL